jgi:Sulfotransferase family
MADTDSVLLFLHVPKAAGSTLASLVYANYANPSLGCAEDGWLRDGIYYYPVGFYKEIDPRPSSRIARALARPELRAVTGHFSFGIDTFIRRDATYITLIRHPVDRISSLYSHILTYSRDDLRASVVSERLDLPAFLDRLTLRELDNDQTRRISGVEPPFGLCTPAVLDRAKGNLQRNFAAVGTVERFDESLLLIARRLHWDHVHYIPRLVNIERPPREVLPKRAIDTAERLNRLDLELHAYANDLLDASLRAERVSREDVQAFKSANEAHIRANL